MDHSMNTKHSKSNHSFDNNFLHTNEDFVSSDHDGEKIILDITSGTYYKTNKIASEILKFLKKPANFKNLLNEIYAKYDAPKAIIEKELKDFIQEAIEAKIIILKSHS
tara:strand:- start:329 stop:652 length:324 start_codon:yes stop_codon:yes gene_type:complete